MDVLIRLQPPSPRSTNQRRPQPHDRVLEGVPETVARRIIGDYEDYLQAADGADPHFLYTYRQLRADPSFEEDQDPAEEVLLALDFSDVKRIEAL